MCVGVGVGVCGCCVLVSCMNYAQLTELPRQLSRQSASRLHKGKNVSPDAQGNSNSGHVL